MYISVDFDGTCVTHEFPNIGKPIGAEIVLKALADEGHDIICMTMRSSEQKKEFGNDTEKDAKDWFKENNIPLYAFNDNPSQNDWSKSRKIFAHVYIDDQFLGCPLMIVPGYSNRAFVDWETVAPILNAQGLLPSDKLNVVVKRLRTKYPEIYKQ